MDEQRKKNPGLTLAVGEGQCCEDSERDEQHLRPHALQGWAWFELWREGPRALAWLFRDLSMLISVVASIVSLFG